MSAGHTYTKPFRYCAVIIGIPVSLVCFIVPAYLIWTGEATVYSHFAFLFGAGGVWLVVHILRFRALQSAEGLSIQYAISNKFVRWDDIAKIEIAKDQSIRFVTKSQKRIEIPTLITGLDQLIEKLITLIKHNRLEVE